MSDRKTWKCAECDRGPCVVECYENFIMDRVCIMTGGRIGKDWVEVARNEQDCLECQFFCSLDVQAPNCSACKWHSVLKFPYQMAFDITYDICIAQGDRATNNCYNTVECRSLFEVA